MSDYVEALRNVPFMSSQNTSVDIVDLFENAVDNMRLYENKEVTGLWFITEPTGDSGKWAYQVEESEDRQAGELWIDCNQEDSNGVVWSTY